MSKLIEGKSWLSILLLIGLITIFSGCTNPEAGIDAETRQTLQNAINMLNNQPGQWQNTMTTTIDELGRVGTRSAREVLADVQSTYNSALGQTGSETRCTADFVGRRVEQKLEAILHKFDNNAPEPKIVPVICSTNPADHISAGQYKVNDAGKTQLVTYYGYDFKEFSKNQTFTADLIYGPGQIVKPNFGFVRIPQNYMIVLDIQAANYSNLDRSKGPAVALKWGDLNVSLEGNSSMLPVIIPTPTPATIGVEVDVNLEGKGWIGWYSNPDSDTRYVGTQDQSRRMEAVRIRLVNAPAEMNVCYKVHVQNNDWMDEVCNGTIAGTTGQGLRMEAIKIRLVNAPADMHIKYRAFVQDWRWYPWQTDGEIAGSTGISKRMEAMNVMIIGQ